MARIAPSGHQVFPDDTFLRQHAVMHALAERTDVPMARVHWFDADPAWFGQPFWIMDRIAGDIPTDTPPYAGQGWLHDAAPERAGRGLGRRASTPWPASTGSTWRRSRCRPAPTPRSTTRCAAHLDHYERFLAWAEDGTPFPLARRALDVLRRDRPPEPAEGPCLVWGDARLSNLIYRDFEVVAVLDWEMSGIGDPLLDLGWWLFADWALTTGSGCTRLPGFPSSEGTAAALVGRHGSVGRRPAVLRAVRRAALHGDHAADGPPARRHGLRAARVRPRQPDQPVLDDLLSAARALPLWPGADGQKL